MNSALQICPQEYLADDYVNGELSDDSSELFEQHVIDCPSCMRRISAAMQSMATSPVDELLQQSRCSSLESLRRHASANLVSSGATCYTQDSEGALSTSTGVTPGVTEVSLTHVTGGVCRAQSLEGTVPELVRYRLLNIAGVGGSGVVWQAWDNVIHRDVAIKILKSEHLEHHHTQRLLREAVALARLSHPHLASVHEFTEIEGQPAIVMEYVPGPTLAQCLQGQPIAEQLALSLMIRITSAIGHAHRAGIIHRDLKPSNILLRAAAIDESATTSLRRLDLKILDFGTARVTDRETMTHVGQILGTPGYMSPEQVSGDSSRISERTDIYGLGAILYELLTGRPPFTSEDPVVTLSRILETEPVRPRLLQPGLSREIELICLKCLSKAPRDRYASAAELLSDLEALIEGRPISARPVNLIVHFSRWVRRHRTLAAMGGGLLVAVMVVVVETVLFVMTEHDLRLEANEAREKAVLNGGLAERNAQLVQDQLKNAMFTMDGIIEIFAPQELLSTLPGTKPVISSDQKRLFSLALKAYEDYLNFKGREQPLLWEDFVASSRYCRISQYLDPDRSVAPEINRMRICLEHHRAEKCGEDLFLEREFRLFEISARDAVNAGQLVVAADFFRRMAEVNHQRVEKLGEGNADYAERLRAAGGRWMNAAGLYTKIGDHGKAIDMITRACAGHERLLSLDAESDRDAMMLIHYRFIKAKEFEALSDIPNAVKTAAATELFSEEYQLHDKKNANQFQMLRQRNLNLLQQIKKRHASLER